MPATDVPDWTTESIIANTVNVSATGTVAVSSISGTVTISGAVTISSGTVAVSSISGTVTISGAVTVSSGTISVSSISGSVNIVGNVTITGGQGGNTNVSVSIPQASLGSYVTGSASNLSAAINIPAGANQLMVQWVQSQNATADCAVVGQQTGTQYTVSKAEINAATGINRGFIVPLNAQDTSVKISTAMASSGVTVYVTAIFNPVPYPSVAVQNDTNTPLYVATASGTVLPTQEQGGGSGGYSILSMDDVGSNTTLISGVTGKIITIFGWSLFWRPGATSSATYKARIAGASSGTVIRRFAGFLASSAGLFGVPDNMMIPGGQNLSFNEGLSYTNETNGVTCSGVIFYLQR